MSEIDVAERGDHCPQCLSPKTVMPSGFLIDRPHDTVTCFYTCRCGHRWSTAYMLSALAG